MSAAENAITEATAAGIFWRVYRPDEPVAGTPLVILHGLFGSGDNWRTQARMFAADRPVLVADMPNHGRSLHTDRVAYPDLATALWDSLDELAVTAGIGIDSAAVLGHSMGGKAAMAMAFARPAATAALVVGDIAPREYPRRHDEIFAAMDAVSTARIARRGEADRLMMPYIPEKPVRLFLLKSLVPMEDGDGYRWQLNLSGLQAAYDDIRAWPFTEARYDGPTLFVTGGASPYVAVADTDAVGYHFPEHRIETIPDAGHWLHAEARDTFVSMVRNFLP